MEKSKAEKIVSNFYNTIGWDFKDGKSEDAARFEDLRPNVSEYVSKCRLRLLRHIPNEGEKLLDMASGPVQYPEYLEFSRNFSEHHCVDLSKDALAKASRKLGAKGVMHHGSFFDLQFKKSSFDCAISLHTIYHIDANLQEDAVRKLIDLVKPGANVIIVYSNPHTLISKLERLRWFSKLVNRKVVNYSAEETLYFYPHKLDWWDRFSDVSQVKIFPWRSLNSDHQKSIIPDNFLGSLGLKLLFKAEDIFPKIFVRYFQYPMIVLKKT